MSEHDLTITLRLDDPARYRILVKGALDKTWEARLGGMSSCVLDSDPDTAITQLVGELLDQAALFGVLNTLYSLRMPLVSVSFLGKGKVVEGEE